jgi:hypothetical protein
MDDKQFVRLVEDAVERATSPLEEEVEDLQMEVRLLSERLGDRALSVKEMEALTEGRVSYRTIYRRIKEGRLQTISDEPVRVLFSEFQRARRNGVLRG